MTKIILMWPSQKRFNISEKSFELMKSYSREWLRITEQDCDCVFLFPDAILCLCALRVQRNKPLRLSLSSSLPYENISAESTFDSTVQETTVSQPWTLECVRVWVCRQLLSPVSKHHYSPSLTATQIISACKDPRTQIISILSAQWGVSDIPVCSSYNYTAE